MAGAIGSMEFLVTQIMLLFQQAIDGFRFSPTEQQLINHLKSEEPGRGGGFCIIPTLENITDFNPEDLPAKFTENSIIQSNNREWWFICPQTQNQRVRVRRKTPCGSSWGITGKPRDIAIDGKKIGFKKILSFPEGKAKKDWIIHEYHLPQDFPNQSGNNVLCHLMRKQDEKNDNSTTGSEDGKFTQAEVEQWYNQFNDEPEGISPELHTISWPRPMQLLHRELESLSIPQSTNIGSSHVPNADLSNAEIQNGEEPDKSIELESSLRRTKDDELADSFFIENPSYTEVQRGEEPRLEKDHQETAATSTEPCITSDEDAVRAKKGQISTTEDCQRKIESLHCVAPLEETEGVKQSTLNSSHLSENRRFSPSLDDEAQAKGLEHEEHKLAGNSPKRRRLDVSDDGPTIDFPGICFVFPKKEG